MSEQKLESPCCGAVVHKAPVVGFDWLEDENGRMLKGQAFRHICSSCQKQVGLTFEYDPNDTRTPS